MSRIYRLCQFAKRVGRSISTLRRWDAGGEFVAKKHIKDTGIIMNLMSNDYWVLRPMREKRLLFVGFPVRIKRMI